FFIFSRILPILLDEDGPEIVDIGAGRAGHEEIAERVEGGPAVVAAEEFGGILALVGEARDGGPVGEGAGVVLRTVDPVRVGGKRKETRQAIDAAGEGQEELA